MTMFLALQQLVPDPDVVAAAAAAAAAVLKTAEATRNAWSDPLVIGMVGGQAILIIGAIGSAVALILNRATVRELKEQAQTNSANIVTVRADTEAIKGHVNSERTEMTGKLVASQLENKLLREMLTDTKIAAQLLAQAAATRGRGDSSLIGAAAAASTATLEKLDSIDTNTADTVAALKEKEGEVP